MEFRSLKCLNKCRITLLSLGCLTYVNALSAQHSTDSSLLQADLQTCIRYALEHQPVIRQSTLDEQITETSIQFHLADWYPQVNFDYDIQHNFQKQTSVIGGNAIQFGVNNTSAGQLSLTQNLFNRDVLLASRTAKDVRQQVRQTTVNNKIEVAVSVSKAFYDVLLTKQQIDLLNEDILRLQRSLKDAYNQYEGGIVDKIDYKRATIALNNAKAQMKRNQEMLKAKFSFLKEQMGYPDSGKLDLQYDTTKMIAAAFMDTTQTIRYENRIEYQQLQTQQRLWQANLSYYKWSYLPDLSAYANYNLLYQNNELSKLYSRNFPNSFAGLRLSLPIFQGGKRTQNIRQAKLELQRLDYDFIALKNNINSSYSQALATYKSNLYEYQLLEENIAIAAEVYQVIQLQYKAGIKAFLEVIIAESDLYSAQVNHINALYQVLSSKLDVEKSLGMINY